MSKAKWLFLRCVKLEAISFYLAERHILKLCHNCVTNSRYILSMDLVEFPLWNTVRDKLYCLWPKSMVSNLVCHKNSLKALEKISCTLQLLENFIEQVCFGTRNLFFKAPHIDGNEPYMRPMKTTKQKSKIKMLGDLVSSNGFLVQS